MRLRHLPHVLLVAATALATWLPAPVDAGKDPESKRLEKIERAAEKAGKKIVKTTARRIKGIASQARRELKTLTKAAKSAGQGKRSTAALLQLLDSYGEIKSSFYGGCLEAVSDGQSLCAASPEILAAGAEGLPTCEAGRGGLADLVADGFENACEGASRGLERSCVAFFDSVTAAGTPCSSIRYGWSGFNGPSCTPQPNRPVKSGAILETTVIGTDRIQVLTTGSEVAALTRQMNALTLITQDGTPFATMSPPAVSGVYARLWTQTVDSFSGGGTFRVEASGEPGGWSQPQSFTAPGIFYKYAGTSEGTGERPDFSFSLSSSELRESESPWIDTEVQRALVESNSSTGLTHYNLRLVRPGSSDVVFEVDVRIPGGLSKLPLSQYVRFGDGASPTLPEHTVTVRAATSSYEWLENPARDPTVWVEIASQRDLATPFLARSDHIVRVHADLVRTDNPSGIVFPFDLDADIVREDTVTSEP